MKEGGIFEVTGLTLEELMGLFIEGSFQLADAYGITGKEDYFKTAEKLISVRNQLLDAFGKSSDSELEMIN